MATNAIIGKQRFYTFAHAMKKMYLHTGSNLDDRQAHLGEAVRLIELYIGPVVRSSSVYLTRAWGITNQPDFLNQALEVHTNLAPETVLEAIGRIERRMGRQQTRKWGPRLIDIDILFYEDQIIGRPGLTIPHPHLHERNFVLAPLAEIAPDFVHPKLRKTISELYQSSPDPLTVEVLEKA